MKWKLLFIGMLLISNYNIVFSQSIKFDEKGKLIGEIPNYIDLIINPLVTLSINLDTKMITTEQKKETDKIEKKYTGNITKSNEYYTYDKGFLIPPAVATNENYIFDKKIDLNISLRRVLASTILNGASSNAITSGEFDKVLYKVDNGVVPEIDITISSLTLCGGCTFDKIKLKKVNVKNIIIKEKYDNAFTSYVPLISTITDADIQKARSEMQILYEKIRNTEYNGAANIDGALLSEITTYTSDHNGIMEGLKGYIEANAAWLKSTAFINGVPTLNPLGFTDENEINAKIKLRETALKLKETERSTINDVFERTKKIDWATFDTAIEKYKALKMEVESSILSLTDEISRLRKQLEDNGKIKKMWANGASILNEVQLFPTKKQKELIYMRHHDATNNMLSMDKNVLPYIFKRYEEDENIKILLHNLEAGKYNGTFDTTIVSITETALFTEAVLPVIDGIIETAGSFGGAFEAAAGAAAAATPKQQIDILKAKIAEHPEFAAKAKLDKLAKLDGLNLAVPPEVTQSVQPIMSNNLYKDLGIAGTLSGGVYTYNIVPNTIIEQLNGLTLYNISFIAFNSSASDVFIDNIDISKVNKLIDEINASINRKDINTFITNYAMVNWLSTQTTPQPYPDLEDAGPVYKTEVYEAKPNDRIPSSVTYSVGRQHKTDSTDKSKAGFNYKVYKKQYIQFTAMAAFFPVTKKNLDENRVNQRSVITYDGSNNTFTTNNYNPYDIVVGAKIYPFGLNIRKWLPVSGVKQKNKEYRSILFKRGDLIGNRFSIMVGLGVSQKQLRNYFFGIGYEIVPGCGINGGVNLYSTPYYNIEQNKLVSTKEHFKPAYFLGFSFDPIVLIQAIALGKL